MAISLSSIRLLFINTLCTDEIVFVYLYLWQINFPSFSVIYPIYRFSPYLSFRGFVSIGNGVFYEEYLKKKRSFTNERNFNRIIEIHEDYLGVRSMSRIMSFSA